MKNIMFGIVVIFIIATFFIIEDKSSLNNNSKSDYEQENIGLASENEVRAIYFSYIELENYIKDKIVDEAKENIDSIISNMVSDGFNWIILHVRPFSDSIYPSNIFLPSKSVTDSDLSFDVLDYFIEVAHSKEVEVHAWINPYRISSDENYIISEGHPAYDFVGTNNIMSIAGKGVFYNPASDDVTSLIVSGVEEIVSNYEVDGIHFDDYFYPCDDIDLDNYSLYIDSGGEMTLDEYRLDNVSRMISSVYSAIKAIDEEVVFGIAPQGNIDNNYTLEYLDVKKILSESGYVDYIMPQIYFGFLNEARPFVETIEEWSSLIEVSSIDLIPALSLYKSGSEDQYAGSGSKEWIDNVDILKRQIVYAMGVSNCVGFSIFRYDHFYNIDKQNENMKLEVENVRAVIKEY